MPIETRKFLKRILSKYWKATMGRQSIKYLALILSIARNGKNSCGYGIWKIISDASKPLSTMARLNKIMNWISIVIMTAYLERKMVENG